MRSTRRRRPIMMVALAAALLTAGCSGIPSSGAPQDITQYAEPIRSGAPAVPRPGQQPDQIVRDFIDASAGVGRDSQTDTAARAFLTNGGGAGWQADASAVMILRDDYRTQLSGEGVVELRGVQVAQLDANRAFELVDNADVDVTFHLTQVDGEWRITDPPRELMITESGFIAAFYSRTAYFLNATGDVLVPDLRYIAIGTSLEVQATRLVNLLLRGPSSTLAGAVSSQFGSSAQMQSNVKLDANGNVRVDLTGVTLPNRQAELALGAQLAWTVAAAAPGVVVSIDGETLTLDDGSEVFTTANTASFSPDRQRGNGNLPLDPWYLDGDGKIINLTTGRAMWGSLGTSGGAISAAMSSANGALAAVVADQDQQGQQLVIGRPLDQQASPQVALRADTISAPAFDRSGTEVWVVQDGATSPEVIRSTVAPPITRQVVQVPQMLDLGPVSSLVLSPDNTRVAMVANGALYIGVIVPSQSSGGAATLTITNLRAINGDLTEVGQVAFLSATQLLVAANDAGGGFRVLHQLSVDGQERRTVTTNGIVNDVTALAVGPNDGPVLIAFDQRVWELDGSLRTGEWVSPDPDEPVVSGGAPFVPN